MTNQETIVAAGNIEVPAVLALRARDFAVSRDEQSGREEWRAERADLVLIGESPIMLLGLAAMREDRGREWRAADADIDAVLREAYGGGARP